MIETKTIEGIFIDPTEDNQDLPTLRNIKPSLVVNNVTEEEFWECLNIKK